MAGTGKSGSPDGIPDKQRGLEVCIWCDGSGFKPDPTGVQEWDFERGVVVPREMVPCSCRTGFKICSLAVDGPMPELTAQAEARSVRKIPREN
ncbi:hypothetical protein KW786_01165 [Candidatus Parcubacteria bacterium]|nr:hypothetical protein [Candidatus Parcubacteria bacterium]